MYRRRVLLFATICLLAFGHPMTTAGEPTGTDWDSFEQAVSDEDVVRSENGSTEETPAVRIVAIAPNPVAYGDAGEHVVLEVSERTNLSSWVLDDGEAVLRLPNRTVEGRVAITTDPDAVVTTERVLGVRGRLALSNAGETIRLRWSGETVQSVSYRRAPEGERYVRGDGEWHWRPAGATDLAVLSVENPRVRAFVLPDAADLVVSTLGAARERVLLAGYTFESANVTTTLCGLRARNVSVKVLLEREPVGGLTTRSADRLDRLVDCGVAVSLVGGEYARYSFHHPKYAVVDRAGLVLSENWKPSGTGGRSNRGWGVLVEDPAFAEGLADLFEADVGWLDAGRWPAVEVEPVDPTGPAASGSYAPRFEPTSFTPERADLLVAPETAEPGVVALLERASSSIRVQQMSIGSTDHPFVQATLAAARRGVSVRILLSAASYVTRENEATVEWLNGVAANESLPLEARLVDPRGRFGKIHVKGVIADDAVVVGSLNWNAHATRENREVVAVLHGEDVAAYYARVFDADWRGGVWRVPVGATVVVLVGGLVGGLVTRRWQFAPETHISPAGADAFWGGSEDQGRHPWDAVDDEGADGPVDSPAEGGKESGSSRWRDGWF